MTHLSGKVFSSGLDLEEHAQTFMEMTTPAPAGDVTKDPARKSVQISRFVSGMQDSFACLDRYQPDAAFVEETFAFPKPGHPVVMF